MRTLAPASVAVLACVVVPAEPIAITGWVVDEAGQPVAQADVWTRTSYDEPRITTESDADGTFRLEVERAEKEFHVVAVAPGLSVGCGNYSPENPGPLTIKLRPEAQVKGIVLDHNKAPLPGAKVTLLSVSPRGDQDLEERVWVGYDGPVNVTTDEQGRYGLEGLGAGTYNVMIDDLSELVAPAPFASRGRSWVDERRGGKIPAEMIIVSAFGRVHTSGAR